MVKKDDSIYEMTYSKFFVLVPWDDDDEVSTDTNGSTTNSSGNNSSLELNDTQKHQLRHRELFLTRQIETILATNIRGKCLVTLHNETESFLSYLNTEVEIYFCFKTKKKLNYFINQ